MTYQGEEANNVLDETDDNEDVVAIAVAEVERIEESEEQSKGSEKSIQFSIRSIWANTIVIFICLLLVTISGYYYFLSGGTPDLLGKDFFIEALGIFTTVVIFGSFLNGQSRNFEAEIKAYKDQVKDKLHKEFEAYKAEEQAEFDLLHKNLTKEIQVEREELIELVNIERKKLIELLGKESDSRQEQVHNLYIDLEKARLINSLSSHNVAALRAIKVLRDQGLLINGALENADISYSKLAGVDLTDVSIRESILFEAELMRGKLKRVDFTNAILKNTNLEEVDMRGGKLDGADLTFATLIRANLGPDKNDQAFSAQGAKFDHSILCGAILNNGNFEALASFCNADMRGVKALHAILDGAAMKGVDLSPYFEINDFCSNLTAASMRGVILDGSNLNSAIFESANFQAYSENDTFASIRGCQIKSTSFANSFLVGVDFSDSVGGAADIDASTTNFEQADLRGTILDNTKFVACVFIRANLGKWELHNQQTSAYGVDWKEIVLDGANLQSIQLGGKLFDGKNVASNLHSAKLRGVNLNKSNLSDVDLSEADLSQNPDGNIATEAIATILTRAKLEKANLSSINLTDAKLGIDQDGQHVDLRSVNFTNSILVGSDLRGAFCQSSHALFQIDQLMNAENMNELDLDIDSEIDVTKVGGADFSLSDASGAFMMYVDGRPSGTDKPPKFQGAMLIKTNFSGALLPSADFSPYLPIEGDRIPTFLNGASFYQAWLSHANLTFADLSPSEDNSRANLSQTNLYRANLQNANLEKADFTNAYMKEANLSHSTLRQAILTYAKLEDCNLIEANMQEILAGSINLKGSDLTRATLPQVTLSLAELQNTNFTDANLAGCIFENSDFRGSNLQGSNLTGVRYQGVNKFQGCTLTGATLTELDFCNAITNANIEVDETTVMWDGLLYDPNKHC